MEFVKIDEKTYHAFFSKCQTQNFWQSIEMAQMRKKRGWEIHYIALQEDGVIYAACALQSLMIFGKYRLFMALRGFLLDYHDVNILCGFLEGLITYLNNHHCLFMKLDPYVPYQMRNQDGLIQEGTFKEDDLIAILGRFGFQHQGFRTNFDEDFEPRFMSVLNLENCDEKSLLAQMQSMTRRNILSTMKNGVTIVKLKREDIGILEKILKDTGKRKHFQQPNKAYFEAFYDAFGEHIESVMATIDLRVYIKKLELQMHDEQEVMRTLRAEVQVHPEAKKTIRRLKSIEENSSVLQKRMQEAMLLNEKHGDTLILSVGLFVVYPFEMIYLFGGSDERFLSFKGSYAIQWHMIQSALQQKIPRYNFYGISGNFQSDADDYGVYLFKKGFHADVVELLGDFIYVGNKKMYRCYQALRKIKHKLKRA